MNDAVAATGRQFKELDARKAVQLGCLSAVERLQRRGILQHQEYLCHAATRSGQLEELKLLHENNTPWDAQTCGTAACGGHFEVLKWLRKNAFPWDDGTCAAASFSGHHEVLQWAHANGFSWDEQICEMAEEAGHDRILEWAKANGAPKPPRVSSIVIE